MNKDIIKRINFVELNAKVNTLAIRKVFPKYGTPLLATILKEKGYEVNIYLEGVSKMNLNKIADCDLICMPVYAPAYNKVKEYAKILKEKKQDIQIIIGGPHVNLNPDTVLDFCDYAVRCEGDEVLPELIECLNTSEDVSRINGISFLKNGEIVHTKDRKPPAIPTIIPDMSLIKGFNRASFGIGKLQNIQNTLQTSRGCKFKCSFCPTEKLYGGVYRNRDIDSIITEIKYKQKFNDFFLVVDNSFFGNKDEARKLLNRLIKENLDASLIVFERHEIGHDTEMLHLMKKAGVKCLIVGVESLVDENLDAFNKKQTSKNVIQSIQNIKNSGIHIIGTFAFGYDGDTKEKASEIVDFIKQNELSLNIFILHDIETDDRKDLLVPLNRRFMTHYKNADPINTDYYDYATGNFVTYFPKKMKPSTLQKCILDIYKDVYSHEYILKSFFRKNIFDSLFGITHGYGIRRLNETIYNIVDNYYMDYLKQIEEGLYDENEVLIEEKLNSIEGLPIPIPLKEQVDMSSYEPLMLILHTPLVIRYFFHKLRWRTGKIIQSVKMNRQGGNRVART